MHCKSATIVKQVKFPFHHLYLNQKLRSLILIYRPSYTDKHNKLIYRGKYNKSTVLSLKTLPKVDKNLSDLKLKSNNN